MEMRGLWAARFHCYYRRADLIIFDDLASLGVWGPIEFQEELLWTLRGRLDANRLTVFLSDSPPDAIPRLNVHLLSALKAGRVVRLC